eukprot:Nitzschia sp. Nitz4//scaffold144_size56818//38519//38861//NITZ4_006542-RA/size56818-snap-gene-0.11-mRNA-1//-1//CDS//3329536531//2175//frame0
MGIDELVTEKCQKDLEATHVECVSEDGCHGGAKVQLKVVSAKFDGVPLLKRHQMVNAIFADELANDTIHALTIKAWTPAQYESKK